jgi:hypothetical protein
MSLMSFRAVRRYSFDSLLILSTKEVGHAG